MKKANAGKQVWKLELRERRRGRRLVGGEG